MEYHYVEGMDRNEQDKVVSHIYAGKVKGDPEGPLCVRGWNRSDGMGFSIFRGNQSAIGTRTVCRRRQAGGSGRCRPASVRRNGSDSVCGSGGHSTAS